MSYQKCNANVLSQSNLLKLKIGDEFIINHSIKIILICSDKQQSFKLNEIIRYLVASVSIGINKDKVMLDLDYKEDSTTETDMNIVMNENNEFIEIQGSAEKKVLKEKDLQKILDLSKVGIRKIINIQKKILLKSI